MTKEIYYGKDKLLVEEEGNLIEIKLKLASEKYNRLLGFVKIDEETLYVKREKEKHLLKKANSIGFNYSLISEAKRFKKVMLMLDGVNYLIPNDYILNYGSFLWFKEVGFERQIFLSMPHISLWKHEK